MYKYIHTCIYIHINMSVHIHTYTNIHTHIQNVHMNCTQKRLERRRGSEHATAVADQGSFALLFRSTQLNHISHLQSKDFIVPTSCKTNTPPSPIPSSQHAPEQFEACAASQWQLPTHNHDSAAKKQHPAGRG